MEVDKYIASGILELYVAGLLTEEENLEVYEQAIAHTEIKNEILAIEAAILELSRAVTPKYSKRKGFEDVKVRIGERKDPKVVELPKEDKSNWGAYLGWAAAVLFGAGLAWFLCTERPAQIEYRNGQRTERGIRGANLRGPGFIDQHPGAFELAEG